MKTRFPFSKPWHNNRKERRARRFGRSRDSIGTRREVWTFYLYGVRYVSVFRFSC